MCVPNDGDIPEDTHNLQPDEHNIMLLSHSSYPTPECPLLPYPRMPPLTLMYFQLIESSL